MFGNLRAELLDAAPELSRAATSRFSAVLSISPSGGYIEFQIESAAHRQSPRHERRIQQAEPDQGHRNAHAEEEPPEPSGRYPHSQLSNHVHRITSTPPIDEGSSEG